MYNNFVEEKFKMQRKDTIKRMFLFFVMFVFAFCNNMFLNFAFANNSSVKSVFFVPKGQTAKILLSDDIPYNAEIGFHIKAILEHDFLYRNLLIAKKGTIVSGIITQNSKAGKSPKLRALEIQITEFKTQEGFSIPVYGILKTDDNSGVLKVKILETDSKKLLLKSEDVVEIVLTQPVTSYSSADYKYDY